MRAPATIEVMRAGISRVDGTTPWGSAAGFGTRSSTVTAIWGFALARAAGTAAARAVAMAGLLPDAV
jgi:hypothetical protein